MEQVQSVQVHVAAAKMGDARILFDDLEAHRRELRGLRGFVSMSIDGRSSPAATLLLASKRVGRTKPR